jgi:hypothetical protein
VARGQAARNRRPRPAAPAEHATGTGPDSVFVHAVRDRSPRRSGPVAVCGYPLRTPSEDRHRDERTFEARWYATADCCADCADALGLDERSLEPEPEPKSSHNWVMIGSILTLVPMASVLLLRIAATALR